MRLVVGGASLRRVLVFFGRALPSPQSSRCFVPVPSARASNTTTQAAHSPAPYTRRSRLYRTLVLIRSAPQHIAGFPKAWSRAQLPPRPAPRSRLIRKSPSQHDPLKCFLASRALATRPRPMCYPQSRPGAISRTPNPSNGGAIAHRIACPHQPRAKKAASGHLSCVCLVQNLLLHIAARSDVEPPHQHTTTSQKIFPCNTPHAFPHPPAHGPYC